MKRVLGRLKRRKFLLAVILISLTPLIWFRPWDTLITGGDFWLPLGTLDTFKAMFGSWLSNVSGGQPNNHIIFPWVAFWALLGWLRFSLSTIEKIWFVSLFFVGGVSIYFLTFEVFPEKKESWKNFLPAVLYLFNLYIMMTGVVTTTLLSYMLLPALLLFYVKGMQSRHPLKWSILLAFVSLFMTSAADNPPIYLIPFFILFLFFAYSWVFRRSAFSLKLNIYFAVFYLLFNVWWIANLAYTLYGQLSQIKAITAAAVVGQTANFYDLVRLLGSWAFFAGHQGFPYFPFAVSYLNPLLMFLTFLIPTLALAGFYLRSRSGKGVPLIYFFFFLVLVGLFLGHGEGEDILGKANIFIKKIIPIFWIYREPYAKFTVLIALGYAVLLGAFFDFLESNPRFKNVVNIIGAAVFILVLGVAWPLVTGDHYPGRRGVLAPSKTKIPSYWFDAADWFRGKEDEGRVLVFPDNPDWNRSGIPYAWGYDSADVGPFLLTVPWVERNNGYYGLPVLSDNVSKTIYRAVNEGYLSPSKITSVLPLLNVSRILQRNDVDLKRVGILAGNYSPEHMRTVLQSQVGLSLEKSFGELDVYRLDQSKYLEKIYVPKKIDCLSGDSRMINYPLEFAAETKTALFSEESNRFFDKRACGDNYVIPVELLKGKSALVSELYPPSFGGKLTRLSYDKGNFDSQVISQDNSRIFLAQVREGGEYFLYFERRDSSHYLLDPNIIVRSLDRQNQVVEAEESPDVPSFPALGFFGKYNLESGEYLIEFSDPIYENLVGNDSFEEGPWKNNLVETPNRLSTDAYSGNYSMSLGMGQSAAFYTLPQEKIETRSYTLSFYYKIKSSIIPTVLIWENNCSLDHPIWVKYDAANDPTCTSNFVIGKTLDLASDWTEYSFDYTPGLTVKQIGIAVAFLDRDGRIVTSGGETLIDSVSFRPKVYGGLVLRMEKNVPQSEGPILAVGKHSPTSYLVSVSKAKAPYYLVFSETFNGGWRATIKDKDSSNEVAAQKHYTVNGYANSWYIEKLGDYEVWIDYVPQRWFDVLVVVSSLSALASLIYLLLTVVRLPLGKRN